MSEEKKSSRVQISVAIITLTGVIGAAVLANIDKIGTLFARQTPVENFAPTTNADPLSGSYMFETDRNRLIKIHVLTGGVYEIGEPIGKWPWSGAAELDGRKFTGFARFKETKASMDVIGYLKPDGSITVEYHFLTRGDGSSADGRVDRHVWVRRSQ